MLDLREQQLLCGVSCDGQLVSLAFKLVALSVGSWAVFSRRSRATLPRVRIARAGCALLAVVFLASHWVFYASHVVNSGHVELI